MSLDVHLVKVIDGENQEVHWSNITHNLTDMAEAAGIYEALWRPYRLKENYVSTEDYDKELDFEDSVQVLAEEIIPVLRKGLDNLLSRPEYFESFNSPNGWGTYKHFIPFVKDYLDACELNPKATVMVWR